MTAQACNASFTRAVELVKQFPEQVTSFGCHPWLMDGQLAEYRPQEANIISFQRRAVVFTDRQRADWAPIEHMFHRRFDGVVVLAC